MTFKKAQAKTIKVGVFKTQKAMNDQKNTQDEEASKVPNKKKPSGYFWKQLKKSLEKMGIWICSTTAHWGHSHSLQEDIEREWETNKAHNRNLYYEMKRHQSCQ